MYDDHLALYRQAQIYSRQGIDLDRPTRAAWVGRAASELSPVHETLLAKVCTGRTASRDTRSRRRQAGHRGGQITTRARSSLSSQPAGSFAVRRPDSAKPV